MLVKELKEILENVNEDANVVFCYSDDNLIEDSSLIENAVEIHRLTDEYISNDLLVLIG